MENPGFPRAEERRDGQGPQVAPAPCTTELAALLAAMLRAGDIETVWSLARDFFRDFGFAHVLYALSPSGDGSELGAPDEYFMLSTLEPAVFKEFIQHGHYSGSESLLWALGHAGVRVWREPFLSDRSADSGIDAPGSTEEAVAFFRKHRFHTGCTVGFTSESMRGRAAMGLLATPGRSREEVIAQIEAWHDVIFTVATVAHRCISGLPLEVAGRKLTERQREVLEWVARGKTTADIAVIMGLSQPTVEKHMRLARETLGVATTAHALIRAAFLNQVFPPGSGIARSETGA